MLQCWILQKIQWHVSWIPILEYIDNSNQKYWNLRTLDICWNINRLLVRYPTKIIQQKPCFPIFCWLFSATQLPTSHRSPHLFQLLAGLDAEVNTSVDNSRGSSIMYIYIYIRHLCTYIKQMYRFIHDAECMCLHVDVT